MVNSLSLLIAVLVSLQCTLEASARGRYVLENLRRRPASAPKRVFRKDAALPSAIISVPPPAEAEFVAGETLVLSCTSSGYLNIPNIQWLKNGEIIIGYEGNSNEIQQPNPPMVATLISKLVVTTAVSGDVFTCLVASPSQVRSASTTIITTPSDEETNLLTRENLFRVPSGPIITSYLDSSFQVIGTDLLLPCRVYSLTATETYWLDHYNKPINDHPKMKMLPSGDLLIRDVVFEPDVGNYTCVVTDVFGRNDTIVTFLLPIRAYGLFE